MAPTIKEIINKVKSYNRDADIKLIQGAYEMADKLHSGQKRLSGDPFISHPLSVAMTLANLEQDDKTVAAALLHDAIEDGDVPREKVAREFSEEVAVLVEGVTKLGRLTYESREKRQAENFRKMFLAMGEDIRIIIIKLADRLHNMQTLQFLPKEKQKETSVETMEIFAPLAHRLGMWWLKGELEDLSFKFLEPEKHRDISEKVTDACREREVYIQGFIEELKKVIRSVGISAQINGRAKHLYSIFRKMISQNLNFEDVYDLIAVRVIVDSIKTCYAVLGVIHASWKPIPGRFRDYIAMPKPNGYQSLHTTVIGPQGRPVEIQIRTTEMHRVSEYGIAAHWRYKEGETDRKLDMKMSWLRQMLDWQKELSDARDFMESLRVDLFADEVFVFTPKGAVFGLPVGATPVDFAYRVHTEVGHRCMGAKVNGRIVPLSHKLKNGDIVEIITGKVDSPKLDWLNFVKTPAARTKVKGWFKRQKRGENIARGEAALEEEIRRFKLDPAGVGSGEEISHVFREYGLSSAGELYSQIGCGEISAYQVARRLRALRQKIEGVPQIEEDEIAEKISARRPAKVSKYGVRVAGADDVFIRFSRCCRPLPGDKIIGFVTKGRGVSIHKSDCPNVTGPGSPKDQLIPVEWIPGAEIYYPVEIEVEAFDRVGVLKDILEKVVETKVNVSAADVKTKRGSSAFIKLVVDIKDTEHLGVVMKAIREVSDVYDVTRAR